MKLFKKKGSNEPNNQQGQYSPQGGQPDGFDPNNGQRATGGIGQQKKFGKKGFGSKGNKARLDTDRARPASKKKGGRTVRTILGLVALIAVVLGYMTFLTNQQGQTVQVVKLKNSIPQGGIFDQSNLVSAEMSAEEYARSGIIESSDGTSRRAIVLAEDVQEILGKSAAHYIRRETPVYWDSIGEETSKRHSYLYSMDGELLSIEIGPGDFGEMIVPGDRINVRIVYQEEVYKLPTREEIELQERTGIAPKTTVEKQEKLFNNVAVLDMLNSNQESIFDVYYNLMSLSKAEQEAAMRAEGFRDAVTPRVILLNVTPEEADHYMRVMNKSPQFLLTLLPRTSSNAITELINEITTGLSRNQQEVNQ